MLSKLSVSLLASAILMASYIYFILFLQYRVWSELLMCFSSSINSRQVFSVFYQYNLPAFCNYS